MEEQSSSESYSRWSAESSNSSPWPSAIVAPSPKAAIYLLLFDQLTAYFTLLLVFICILYVYSVHVRKSLNPFQVATTNTTCDCLVPILKAKKCRLRPTIQLFFCCRIEASARASGRWKARDDKRASCYKCILVLLQYCACNTPFRFRRHGACETRNKLFRTFPIVLPEPKGGTDVACSCIAVRMRSLTVPRPE